MTSEGLQERFCHFFSLLPGYGYVEYHELSVLTRGLNPIFYDIFTQQHWLLVKLELIFINNCKDHIKSSDASWRQYIFFKFSFIPW